MNMSCSAFEAMKEYSRPPLPTAADTSRFSEHSGRFLSLYDAILHDEHNSSDANKSFAHQEGSEDISERLKNLNRQLSNLSNISHLYKYDSLPFMVSTLNSEYLFILGVNYLLITR